MILDQKQREKEEEGEEASKAGMADSTSNRRSVTNFWCPIKIGNENNRIAGWLKLSYPD